jgi:regulator of protease activity HflC (stomatin/prohibitin superfamily)
MGDLGRTGQAAQLQRQLKGPAALAGGTVGRGIAAVIALIVLVQVISGVFAPVEAGHVGILTTWGRAEPSVLAPGLNFKWPLAQNVTDYSIRVQVDNAKAAAASKDLQDVSAVIAINYHPDPTGLLDIHQTIGPEFKARVIDPAVQEAFKATTAQYTANELVTKREEVKVKARELLRERLSAYRIVVVDLNIVAFEFSKEFIAAIEAANVARQQVITAQQTLERQKIEAQQQIVQAEAYANAAITRARADAEANRLLAESVTERLISLRTVEKWNGQLPSVSGGSIPFVNVPIP